MDTKTSWFDKVFSPIIVGLVLAGLVPTVSKLNTGNWATLWKLIPDFAIYSTVAGLTIWQFWTLYKKRRDDIKNNPIRRAYDSIETRKWAELTTITYAKAIWIVIAPRQHRNYEESYLFTPVEDIAVVPNPRCPRCKMELEQSQRFLGGYYWKCINCFWGKVSKDHFLTEMNRVERMARRVQEQRQEEWRQQGNNVPITSNFRL